MQDSLAGIKGPNDPKRYLQHVKQNIMDVKLITIVIIIQIHNCILEVRWSVEASRHEGFHKHAQVEPQGDEGQLRIEHTCESPKARKAFTPARCSLIPIGMTLSLKLMRGKEVIGMRKQRAGVKGLREERWTSLSGLSMPHLFARVPGSSHAFSSKHFPNAAASRAPIASSSYIMKVKGEQDTLLSTGRPRTGHPCLPLWWRRPFISGYTPGCI